MKLVLRSEAEQDIADAARWYDRQRERLGDRFLEGVDEAFAQIRANPEAYPLVMPRIRRILLSTFPYGVFYLLEPAQAVVVGCFHVRQNPRHWTRRS